ncbi:MAG: hypothetical protein IPK22_11015 [Verrucomicrobiaceae bacterium]|nr:hypothetical protein [Verrucomicrobiaceae bacterium]
MPELTEAVPAPETFQVPELLMACAALALPSLKPPLVMMKVPLLLRMPGCAHAHAEGDRGIVSGAAGDGAGVVQRAVEALAPMVVMLLPVPLTFSSRSRKCASRPVHLLGVNDTCPSDCSGLLVVGAVDTAEAQCAAVCVDCAGVVKTGVDGECASAGVACECAGVMKAASSTPRMD